MYCLSLNLIFDYLLHTLTQPTIDFFWFHHLSQSDISHFYNSTVSLHYHSINPQLFSQNSSSNLPFFIGQSLPHSQTYTSQPNSGMSSPHPNSDLLQYLFFMYTLVTTKASTLIILPTLKLHRLWYLVFFFSFLGGDMCVSLPTRCTYISLSGLSLGVSICALVYITDSSPSSSSPPLLLSVSVPTSPVRVILVHSSDCRTLTFPESVDGPELWWLLTDCTSYDRLYTVLIPYLICPSSYSPVPPFQFL